MESVTVLTPTYNRGHLLGKLYDSLCKQTDKSFQWLIIDDGSVDNTEDVVKNFCAMNVLSIEYHKKNNGGKHTALNYSHSYIKGGYVVIVDSDDYLLPCAIEEIRRAWFKYPDASAIIFQRGNMDGMSLDNYIQGEYISDLPKEINKGMHGDHCETFSREAFVKYAFPVYESENFVAEGAMWVLCTKESQVVFLDKVIYLCEYLPGGLTKSGRSLRIKNPKGGMWHAKVFLDESFSKKIRVKNVLLYICYGLFAGMNRKEIIVAADMYSTMVKKYWFLGKLLYVYWNRKYGD